MAAGLVIVPVCPYIKNYVEKHTQYAANIKTPTPAILEFLTTSLAEDARR